MANLKLAEFIENTSNGQVFTVEFYKRGDGSLRKMNCRRGVQKGVKGVGLKFDPKEKNLLVVYDMHKIEQGSDEKGAFRMINLSDLKTLKMGGKAYDWDHASQTFVEA
ncbi:hypothetical protein D3C87_650700 [compost metagenome]